MGAWTKLFLPLYDTILIQTVKQELWWISYDKNCSLLLLHFFKHNLTRYLSTECFCLSILNTPRDIPTLQTETRTEPTRFSQGSYPTKFLSGRLRPEVQPLTLLYTIFDKTSTPFFILFINKWYPFYSKKTECKAGTTAKGWFDIGQYFDRQN